MPSSGGFTPRFTLARHSPRYTASSTDGGVTQRTIYAFGRD